MSADDGLGIELVAVSARDAEVVRRFAKELDRRVEVRVTERVFVGQFAIPDRMRAAIERKLVDLSARQCSDASLLPIRMPSRPVRWSSDGVVAVAELTVLVVPVDVFDGVDWEPR